MSYECFAVSLRPLSNTVRLSLLMMPWWRNETKQLQLSIMLHEQNYVTTANKKIRHLGVCHIVQLTIYKYIFLHD